MTGLNLAALKRELAQAAQGDRAGSLAWFKTGKGKLRPANIDAAAGAVEEIARIVAQIRARWPHTRIILRADSGFARDALMGWCAQSVVFAPERSTD
jgi:tRNA U34 5-methylaminomethyl-2-thiouridine-forming methyltransferase MnmC